MAFLTNCTNKGCGEYQSPYLDPLTNKVHCSSCDREIANITQFAKNQMKMSKQFKPKATSFLVKCGSCKKEDRPRLGDKDILICNQCGKKLTNISLHFETMLKEFLKKKDD